MRQTFYDLHLGKEVDESSFTKPIKYLAEWCSDKEDIELYGLKESKINEYLSSDLFDRVEYGIVYMNRPIEEVPVCHMMTLSEEEIRNYIRSNVIVENPNAIGTFVEYASEQLDVDFPTDLEKFKDFIKNLDKIELIATCFILEDCYGYGWKMGSFLKVLDCDL